MSIAKNIYSRGSDIITVITEDSTGRKIDKKRASSQDELAVAHAFQSIIDKYGLDLKIIHERNQSKASWYEADEEFKW